MVSRSEERPLLGESECDSTPAISEAQTLPISTITTETPLPKVQFAILCLLRPLDPMSFTQIFPYINEFMNDLHVTDDPSQIGLYSGLVESSFALSQLLAVYPWGVFSDRLGRRPVVLIGMAGVAITTLLFGFSTSFLGAVLTRGLGAYDVVVFIRLIFTSDWLWRKSLRRPIAGLFSGNIAVIPTILIELTDRSNQAFAFSFFGFWWPLGAIIGPLIGGLLSKPAIRYPKYFNHHIFRVYPYFLPCLVVSTFATFCFIVSWALMKETLHRNEEQKGRASPHVLPYGSTADETSPARQNKYSMHELFNIPIIRALCASGCSLSFISTAFEVIFVLFCYSPVMAGGLAFSTSEIGFALSASGFVAAVLQLFFMPTILRRVNHSKMYHFCMKIWPYAFLCLPLLNWIARRGFDTETGEVGPHIVTVLWIGVAITLCIARVAFLAYSVNMLLIKRFAPNSASMGSTTGLVQFSICFARAFSPAFASSVFAFSVRSNLLAGYFWVVVMALIGLASSLFSRNIVKESLKARA